MSIMIQSENDADGGPHRTEDAKPATLRLRFALRVGLISGYTAPGVAPLPQPLGEIPVKMMFKV